MDITFASLVTPPGIVVAAGLVTSLVALLKASLPPVQTANGATLAFVFSALLYAVTAAVLNPPTPDGFLLIFAAFLACGTSAVGIKVTTEQVQKAGGS